MSTSTIELTLTTRDGVEITVVDPTTSYIGTADGMGYAAPAKPAGASPVRVSVRTGRGTAVHSASKFNGVLVGTACGTDARFAVQGLREVTASVTCKRCLRALEARS